MKKGLYAALLILIFLGKENIYFFSSFSWFILKTPVI